MLGTAGLSIITRYLLLAATLLAIFAGAGVFGWLQLEPGDRARRWWAIFAAIAAVVMVAFIPAQAQKLDRLNAALDRQDAILVDLRGYFGGGRECVPVTLPNRRAVPQVALWTGLSPGSEIRSGQDDGIGDGVYFQPTSGEVADDFVLDRRDLDKRIPPAPSGWRPYQQGDYWRMFISPRCMQK